MLGWSRQVFKLLDASDISAKVNRKKKKKTKASFPEKNLQSSKPGFQAEVSFCENPSVNKKKQDSANSLCD